MLTHIPRFNVDENIYKEPPKYIIMWEYKMNYCKKYFIIYEIKGIVLTTTYIIYYVMYKTNKLLS